MARAHTIMSTRKRYLALTVVMAWTQAVRRRSGTSMTMSRNATITVPSTTPPMKPMYELASSSVRKAPYSAVITAPNSRKAAT